MMYVLLFFFFLIWLNLAKMHEEADQGLQSVILWRENQRISLRSFLRSLLHNPQIANTVAMQDFLKGEPMTPTDDDVDDIMRRKVVDEKRIEEQKKFYEIARKRAAELDEYMEQ